MPAADVPMVIDQGEDWTTEIVWTDNYDEPVNIVHPCRMEIRAQTGAVVVTLETDPDIPPGSIPGINVSPDIGMLQMHIPRAQTAALVPGVYFYDLFVTCDDGNEFSGLQVTRLLFGQVTVNKRITQMT